MKTINYTNPFYQMGILHDFKWPIILLFCGAATQLLATAMRIMYWVGYAYMQIASTGIIAIAIALILFKLIFSKNDNQASAGKS